MTVAMHPDYNRSKFPHLVVNHGNWDVCAADNGYCAAIPTAAGEAAGCKASHFGDMAYVKVALAKELAAKAQAERLAAEAAAA